MTAPISSELDPRVAFLELARIITLDDPDEALVHAGRLAAQLTAAEHGRAVFDEDLFPDLTAPRRLDGTALETEAPLPPELRPVGGMGVQSWLAVPLYEADGRRIGLIAVANRLDGDFTERDEEVLSAFAVAVAAALGRARAVASLQDAHLQRQAFFGVISHELRTPITTIYGGSRVLRQSGSRLTHDARQQLLDDVAEEAERLYRLVEDLLVLSRTERDAPVVAAEPILLQHLVSRVVTAEQQHWPRARLRVTTSPGLPPVMGDSTLVEQVLRNLLSNAAKYAGAAGPIEVVAAGNEGWVEVRVLDQGPGVEPDALERVFELFYRGSEAPAHAQGAGIGLYACRQLVEAMGGSVWALPRTPVGAEFGFRLRAHGAEDEPAG